MDIRQISSTYAVSPQIGPADAPQIAAAGFVKVICNRPDGEVPPSHQAHAIEQAVVAAGLAFEILPLTHQTMTHENVSRQNDIVTNAQGPVLAYCASGTRSSIAWALGRAGHESVDDILSAAAQAGYDLSGMRPTLEALARAQSGS